MSPSKTKSRSKAKDRTSKNGPETAPVTDLPEVLTLAEAAAYLRVSEEDVIELAAREDLPGRKIKKQWRFYKAALSHWLCSLPAKERLLRHAGAAKDDPYLEEMLEKIYRDRGRPMTEDGE